MPRMLTCRKLRAGSFLLRFRRGAVRLLSAFTRAEGLSDLALMEEPAFEPTYPIDRYAAQLDALTNAQGQSQRGGLERQLFAFRGAREAAILARFASAALRPRSSLNETVS